MSQPTVDQVLQHEAFQGLSEASQARLRDGIELLSFDLGQQLVESGVIPGRVLILLEGRARLVGNDLGRLISLGKFDPGAVLGAASLLCGRNCENLIASDARKAAASSEEKLDFACEAGADLRINYSNEDFLQRVQEITNQSGVDVVYDSVGKDTMFNSFKALKRHGTVVSFGQSSGAYTDLQMTDLAFGSFHLTRPTLFHFYANRNWLENASAELFELISSEKVKLDQVTKYPLENVAQAHTDIENRKTTGSVILEI